MNIVVIVEDIQVDVFKKWSDLTKHHPTLNKDEFVKHGEDYICVMDLDSYRISRDIGLLESVATEAVFGKKKPDYLTAVITAITVVFAIMMFT